jgi:hypothetical protein
MTLLNIVRRIILFDLFLHYLILTATGIYAERFLGLRKLQILYSTGLRIMGKSRKNDLDPYTILSDQTDLNNKAGRN